MSRLLVLSVLLAGAVASSADVHFVEEVVNQGFGAQQIGARRTVNEVYIKGRRQKVQSTIQTSEQTARKLREQGKPLKSITILALDDSTVYEIDWESQTFVRKTMPAAKPAIGDKAAEESSNPRIAFAAKETGDSTQIAGVTCRKVVAQMRARYYDPETGQPRRENRYTYEAWLAKDFPGYQEIKTFQQLQEQSTSYPPLISGGVEQLKEVAAQDSDRLEAELEALEGFPMRSTVRVTVRRPDQKGTTEVFRLDRRITELEYESLADSVFRVSKALKRVGPQ